MGRVLFITSFKGGVGKTTLSANLSAVLARMGYRVLAVDGDMGMRCMDMALGEENGAVYNIADVLEGKCTAERAIVQSGTVDGLFFLASPANRPEVIPEREKFLKLFALLREGYDYVIIDSSAEETPYYLSFAACADDAVANLAVWVRHCMLLVRDRCVKCTRSGQPAAAQGSIFFTAVATRRL